MKSYSALGIENIYVIHAKNGYEAHERRIHSLFEPLKMKYEFVTDGDPGLFTKKLLDDYFTQNIELSQGVLSCTLNHILSYEKIAHAKNKYALIFENDPFFLGNFLKKITRIMKEIKLKNLKNFIISLENTCMRYPSYWDTKKDACLYRASAGRAAGAYLIDFDGAVNMLNDLKQNKCHTYIDWWHNGLIDRGIIYMYWAHPPLVEQGSHNGRLHSTISSKNRSVFRRIRWNIQKLYKYYFRRLFNEKRILKLQ